jgi:hypothetical protein
VSILQNKNDSLPNHEVIVGVIPDLHVPFHDKERVAEAFNGVRNCDHIVLMGDVIDCYSCSGYDKNPARRETLQDELDEGYSLLRELRKAVGRGVPIDYLEGNHEDRLRRLLWQKAPALASLRNLSIPELMNLDVLGITYHGRSGFKKWGARFKHGDLVRAKAGYTARAEMEAHRATGFSAHTHRMGSAVQTDKEGVITEWWECGHLCLTSSAEYVASPDWQAGYLLLNVSPDGIYVEPVKL